MANDMKIILLDKARHILSDLGKLIEAQSYNNGELTLGAELNKPTINAYMNAKEIVYAQFPDLRDEVLGVEKMFEGLEYRVTDVVADTESSDRYAVYKPLNKWKYHAATVLLRPFELAKKDHTIVDNRNTLNLETKPLLRGKYEHMKSTSENPKFYEMLDIGIQSETKERFAVYCPLYKIDLGINTALCRDLDMFSEMVNRKGTTKQRFRYVGPVKG